MSTNKQFFPALTGYRAIAAWMIFLYHFMPFDNPKYPEIARHTILNFHIGVEMFFVLSGFLITYRYFNDYPIHFKKYMVNRFARIYPMYFLITFIFFLVWFLQNGWTSEKTIEAVLSFTMTKALFLKYNLTGVAQGWTLTLEEIFYLAAPLYFILIRKTKWNLIILPVLIFLFGVYMKDITDVPGNKWGFLQQNIAIFIFDFFAGIGLAYFILKRKINFSGDWVTCFGLTMIIFYLFGKHYVTPFIDFKSDFGSAFYVIFLACFGIVPLLWGLINEKTVIQKILSNRTFVLLGKSSYIFYLIHKGFVPIFIFDYIVENKFVIFILLNVISIVLFLYVEEPLNHYIRNKFGKNKISSDKTEVTS
ncbi:acyltransferase family protein [Epilithonimonas sp. UC225_85]|uniref:acyltransferase family protein n=1 Tax=Epilithonimonas sp. UC225_85 TaxID=3350167 RepID=UPI0036D2DF36